MSLCIELVYFSMEHADTLILEKGDKLLFTMISDIDAVKAAGEI